MRDAGVAHGVGTDVEAVAVFAARARRHGRLQCRAAGQLSALPLALCQHQLHPLRHVGHAGADAASGRLCVGLARRLLHDVVPGLGAVAGMADAFLHMAPGAVGLRRKVGKARTGVGHAQRAVQRLLGQRGPVRALRLGHGLGGGGEAEVGVVVTAVGLERHPAQALQDVGTRVTHVFQHVAGMVGQAAAVRVQLAQGQARVVGRVGIGQSKVRQQALDGGVPVDGGRACGAVRARHVHRHHRGAHGLGHRGDLKHRVGVHRRGLVHAPQAEALGVHRLALEHHRHRRARHPGARQPLRHQGVQQTGSLLDGVGVGGGGHVAVAAAGAEGDGQAGGAQAGAQRCDAGGQGHVAKVSSSQSIETAAE